MEALWKKFQRDGGTLEKVPKSSYAHTVIEIMTKPSSKMKQDAQTGEACLELDTFTRIPNALFIRELDLTPSELLYIIGQLVHCYYDGSEVYASYERIAALTRLNIKTVYKTAERLHKRGLITRKERPGESDKTRYDHDIYPLFSLLLKEPKKRNLPSDLDAVVARNQELESEIAQLREALATKTPVVLNPTSQLRKDEARSRLFDYFMDVEPSDYNLSEDFFATEFNRHLMDQVLLQPGPDYTFSDVEALRSILGTTFGRKYLRKQTIRLLTQEPYNLNPEQAKYRVHGLPNDFIYSTLKAIEDPTLAPNSLAKLIDPRL
jgi:predicted transcriptional regulator